METPATPGGPSWNSPLPTTRKGATKPGGSTFGDYFQLMSRFLEKNNFEPIRSALGQKSGRVVASEDVEEIRIVAEKHGKFYHPARILVIADSERIPFVLNVALSEEGKKLVKKECGLLKRLNLEFDYPFIPNVYASETENGPNPNMFLGEWFEAYHEFHLSRDPQENIRVKVWDPSRGPYFLSDSETFRLRSLMSMILTCFYNPLTFEQIHPWRHAAGDFVLKMDGNVMDVRLITVRGYRPRFGCGGNDTKAVAGAMLLLFLLDTSLWMRLDREDGVGDIIWADDDSVAAVLEGFFRGIGDNLAEEFVTNFKKYLLSCSRDDLTDLLDAIMRSYNPEMPEIRVVGENLDRHAAILHAALNRY